MKYRFKYNGNHEFVTLHTTCKMVEDYISDTTVDRAPESAQELFRIMQGVPGAGASVAYGISIKPYEISACRGLAFERDEVLNSMLETLVIWLKMNGYMADDEELVQLPTLRSDIRHKQCRDCIAEQNREMARSMRNWDTLEP